MGKSSESSNRLVANNKKAYYDYFIDEKYEAGIVLHGTEVKSLRQGKCSIKESYIQIQNNEIYAINMNITPYEKGNIFNKDPLRPKKLLLHRSEINKLAGKLATKGYTLVPLQVYFKQGKVKIEIGLARGKKNYDKRESIAKRDQERQAQKELKSRNYFSNLLQSSLIWSVRRAKSLLVLPSLRLIKPVRRSRAASRR